MSDDRGGLLLEISTHIRADMSLMKRESMSQGVRLAAIKDHQRGIMTSIYGMQADIGDLKTRVDRIERRLGLTDTEH